MSILNKYLNKSKEDVTLIQARIPSSMLKDLKPIMKQYGLTWTDVIKAGLEYVLNELKTKKMIKRELHS